MPKTIIDSLGIRTTTGRGLEIREVTVFEGMTAFSASADFSGSTTMRTPRQPPPRTYTVDFVVPGQGLFYASGSVPITGSLPGPSHPRVRGRSIIVRNETTNPWALTCSAVPHDAFVSELIRQAQKVGSLIEFPAVQYTSIVLTSDGYRYLVMGGTGSYKLS